MNEQLSQVVDKLKTVQNVLVTVSKDPSVDQLAAAIGLTAGLNNADKRATAVYSGVTPETIEFLKPEETLEKNTDSLRDFIIALDKAKADKLRYKVEDDVVRIYVTPYRTSLSEADLQFSQGDFNVEMVLALGVRNQEDLDEAIRAHGRIFHNATVVSVDIGEGSDVGTLHWFDGDASSLSEMVADLLGKLDSKSLDAQVSTALLTGIVSSTDRFSNDKTSPRTMSTSAALMAAGANQQLISAELQPEPEEPEAEPAKAPEDPSTLELSHDDRDDNEQESSQSEEDASKNSQDSELDDDETSVDEVITQTQDEKTEDISADEIAEPEEDTNQNKTAEITVDEEGHLRRVEDIEAEQEQANREKADKPELTLPTPTDAQEEASTTDVTPARDEAKEPDFLSLPSEPKTPPTPFGSQQVDATPQSETVQGPDKESPNDGVGPLAPPMPPAGSFTPPPSPGRVMPKAVAPAPTTAAPQQPIAPPPVEPGPFGPPGGEANPAVPPVSDDSAQALDQARDAVDAALSEADSTPSTPPMPAQGATLSHKAPTLTPPPQKPFGGMPPMPPLPELPDPKLAPAPTGFVPPKPTAPPPPPPVGSVPPLPPMPPQQPIGPPPSLVPPVPSGNPAPPVMAGVQSPAGPPPGMAPPPMAPPILPPQQ